MQAEARYRCISTSCARSMPRPVKFCPYCGTAQHGVVTAAAAARPAPTTVPDQGAAASSGARRGAGGRASAGPGSTPGQGAPAGMHAVRAAAAPAPAPGAPAPVPGRAPLRLRWWLLALAGLWLAWSARRPTPEKIDARIDHAIALATECKARDAQSELIALRSTEASSEQLQRVQQALNDAAAACTRSHQHGRALARRRRGGSEGSD